MDNSENRFSTTNKIATEFFPPVTWNLGPHHLPMKHAVLAQDTVLQLAQVQEVEGKEAT